MRIGLFVLTTLPALAMAQDCPLEADEPPQALRFEWKTATSQSFKFLTIEHGVRLIQPKTRRNLGGPFLRNYASSVKNLSGWADGDGIMANYIGHPAQGAVAGYIFIHNDPVGRKQEIGASSEYWKSRIKAFGWSAAYSTQFELGPFSEASIGNVGMKRGTMGYVDLVVTPVGGVGWIFAEDWLDKFVVRRFEAGTESKTKQRFLRVAFNPLRAFANVLRGERPWYRDTRALP